MIDHRFNFEIVNTAATNLRYQTPSQNDCPAATFGHAPKRNHHQYRTLCKCATADSWKGRVSVIWLEEHEGSDVSKVIGVLWTNG